MEASTTNTQIKLKQSDLGPYYLQYNRLPKRISRQESRSQESFDWQEKGEIPKKDNHNCSKRRHTSYMIIQVFFADKIHHTCVTEKLVHIIYTVCIKHVSLKVLLGSEDTRTLRTCVVSLVMNSPLMILQKNKVQ